MTQTSTTINLPLHSKLISRPKCCGRDRFRALSLFAFLFLTGAKPNFLMANETSGETSFLLGVQTHFSQGWDVGYQGLMPGVGAIDFRDELHWDEIEVVSGIYDFSGFTAYLDAAERAELNPLVLFIGTNPNHDGGNTPFTEEGRAGFARYVAASVAAFPDQIKRIEIGNEYNSDFADGPFRERSGFNTGELIKAVIPAVKAVNPDVEILCTGAHSVATGYLRDVFETGALDYCDAVSFHPYRGRPEHVDFEIKHLQSLMREFGGEKPLYATEFGNWFEHPSDAPDYLMKMVALMASTGMAGAYWYALLNEEWWPNMGLYEDDRKEMPAAATFRFLQKELLPLGRPVARGNAGEDQVFEFGDDGRAFLVWGSAPGRIHVKGNARFFDTSGNSIDPRLDVSPEPVVVMGDELTVEIRRDRPVRSAFFGYGAAPWSYLAMKPDGEEVPFRVMDWNWGPYYGDPYHNPMSITSTSLEAAIFDDRPFYSIERFTAEETGTYDVAGQWFNDQEEGADGADVRITMNGEILATGVVAGSVFEWTAQIAMKAGDKLDFAVGPNTEHGLDWVDREITILGP